MKKKQSKKVMVYGTFDILHPGHISFLKQAKSLGSFLVVSVSRDANAKKFKGVKPVFGEKERREIVGAIKMVDKAVLGDKDHYLRHTLKENPDIIALGYDQKAYGRHLQEDIQAGKLKVKLVRLRAYKSGKYKSTRYKNVIRGR